jgi:hypothetical protein
MSSSKKIDMLRNFAAGVYQSLYTRLETLANGKGGIITKAHEHSYLSVQYLFYRVKKVN